MESLLKSEKDLDWDEKNQVLGKLEDKNGDLKIEFGQDSKDVLSMLNKKCFKQVSVKAKSEIREESLLNGADSIIYSKKEKGKLRSLSDLLRRRLTFCGYFQFVDPVLCKPSANLVTDLTSLVSQSPNGGKLKVFEIEIKTVSFEGDPHQMCVISDISYVLTQERSQLKSDF